MEKKNNNGMLVGILIGIIIMLVVVGGLFATKIISFSNGKTSDNHQNENKNEESIDKKIYTADEYITLEDINFNSKVSTKKVKLNHLDDSVTSEFYKDQEKVINNIHPSDSEVFNAEYKLKYAINNNILSVVYTIEETNEIGTCAVVKAVTNIDLVNNKVISEEELLQKAGTSYRKIVEDRYDKELENWKEHKDFDYYEVTFEDFSNNKEKYVNKGMEKIADFIYTYIEDGKVKYDYYTISLDTLFHQVGKGGCFIWDTIILGEYN